MHSNVNSLDPNTTIRNKLATAYRIIASLGWDDHTYTHLSARSAEGDSFFILAFGDCFSEVAPDSFLQVDFTGKVISGIERIFNPTGYVIHSAIYQARPDINAIFHLHTIASIAVSVDPRGLLPLSQHALHLYARVAYHEYDSLVLDPKIQAKNLASDLAQARAMLLKHHGSIVTGSTIEEAMFFNYHFERACQAQLLALSACPNPELPPESVCKKAESDLTSFEKPGLGIRDWQAWERKLNLPWNS